MVASVDLDRLVFWLSPIPTSTLSPILSLLYKLLTGAVILLGMQLEWNLAPERIIAARKQQFQVLD